MADEQQKVIRIVIDSSKAVDGGRAAQRALDQIEKQTGSMASAMDRAMGTVGRLGGLLAAGFGARAILDAAEAFTRFNNTLLTAGVSAGNLAAVQERLFAAANRNGVEIGALATLYSRASMAGAELGASQDKLLKFTDGVTAALRLQGGSTESASGALLQLSQAMGSGTVRAEEFASILGGAYPIAQAAARGIDGMGGSVGKLRIAVANGQITSKQFFEGMLKGFTETEKQAASMNLTVGGALQSLSNSWTRFIGEMDKGAGVTAGLGRAISALAKVLDGPVRQHVKEFADSIALIGTHKVGLDALFEGLNIVGLGFGGAMAGQSAAERALRGIAEAEGEVVKQRRELQSLQDLQGQTGMSYRYDSAIADQRQRVATAEANLTEAQNVYRAWEERRKTLTMPPVVVNGTGGGGTGARTNADKSYEKFIEQLKAAAAAQDDMVKAADRGGRAFTDQQIHVNAVQKAVEIFGKALDDTDPRLRKMEDLMSSEAYGKLAVSFAQATNELRDQNEVLAAQIRLMGEAPEIQARELAVIKATQEAKKAGIPLDSDRFKARAAEIEQNETLKLQAEQMKTANELWTAPLKQALENLQTAGADAWEAILDSGSFTLKSLGDLATKTLRRMAAEFLSLATIRPVLSLIVEVIGPGGVGLIGGQTAAQLGVSSGGGGATGSGVGSILGGGTGSIFSSGGAAGGGWLARQFSGIGDWLNSPVSGLFSSTPAGGFANVGDLISSGKTLASSAAGGGVLGGLTIGSALAGVGSIGMGAYGLLSGNGSTASTIGSVGQMVGGALMFVPGLQPVGAAISLLSGILPGLFGDSGPKIPPMPALDYGSGQFRPTGTGTYSYTGDSLGGGTALNSQAETLANSLTAAFKAAGLTAVPDSLIGGNIASGTAHMWNGQQWQDSPYTETGLIGPDGSYTSLTANDTSRTAEQAAEYLTAQVFRANVLHGGVSGAGEGLKAGLEKINPITSADLDRVVSLGTAYDKLGQSINPAKDALDKISASFDDLKDYATQAGLSLDPINAELAKQSKRSAQDYIDAMTNPLAVQKRLLDDALEQALTSAEYIKEKYQDVEFDITQIVDYYGKQRVALEDQYYQGGITNLQALIDRLSPGGALANEDPTTKLAGLKSNYETTLASARTGDVASIANLANVAGQYAEYGQSYFAGSADYTALRDQIVADVRERQVALSNASAVASSSSSDEDTRAMVKNAISLTQANAAQTAETNKKFDELMRRVTELTNLTSRYLTTTRTGR